MPLLEDTEVFRNYLHVLLHEVCLERASVKNGSAVGIQNQVKRLRAAFYIAVLTAAGSALTEKLSAAYAAKIRELCREKRRSTFVRKIVALSNNIFDCSKKERTVVDLPR